MVNPVALYRLSHTLYRRGFRRLAQGVKFLNGFIFHAIIPPQMEAGESLTLCHYGFGIIIHPRTVLGNNVRIHPHAILATDVDLNSLDFMYIADDVTIGAGAIILGPRKIGKGSYVGAGAVVTKDIPPGVIVAGNPARILKEVNP